MSFFQQLFLLCFCLNVSFLNCALDEQNIPALYWISPDQVKTFLNQNSHINRLLQIGEISGVVDFDEVGPEIEKACKAVANRLVLNSKSTLYDVLSQSFGHSQKPSQDVEKVFCDNIKLDTYRGVLSNHWLHCGDVKQAETILCEIGIALCNALRNTHSESNYLNYWVTVGTRQLSDKENVECTLEVVCLISAATNSCSDAHHNYIQNGDFLHEVALDAGHRTKLVIIGSVIVMSISFLYDYLIANF